LYDQSKIKRISIVLSSFFNQTKKPEVAAEELIRFAKKHHSDVKLAFVWNHAKVMGIKSGSNYYIIEGSGNLSDNARIEQYLIENCKETYDFHNEWISEICTKYGIEGY